MFRTRTAGSLLLAATLCLPLGFAGCASDNDTAPTKRTGAAPPPSAAANAANAQDKVAAAEAAERTGDYSRALEAYEQLRSFPEASRPKDLDARIDRVKKKMATQPQ